MAEVLVKAALSNVATERAGKSAKGSWLPLLLECAPPSL